MKYRPEIDGLRSVAVLPVILFHAGLGVFSGGYLGVDVFFVISGYLITTIIVSEVDAGTFSIVNFYNRRARRILPALFLVVLCCMPFAWFWMLPVDFKDFAQSIAAVSLFSSNILFWIESDYFAPAAELKPLLHTWSLAVEEQYYIAFPLILMLLWPRSRRATLGVLAAILIVSLAVSHYLLSRDPAASFYLIPARAWELMVGSFTAIIMRYSRPGTHESAALAGLALIVLPMFIYGANTPFPGLYAIPPVLGTALVILYGRAGTLVARLLSLRAPVMIGLISYSAYLWHQPIFAFARIRSGHATSPLLMLALAALSLALAYLSWRFVEQPARRIKLRPGPIVLRAGIASAGFFAIGAVLSLTSWHQSAFLASVSPQNRPILAQIEEMRSMNHYASEDDGPCRFYIEAPDAEADARMARCHAEHGKAVLILGDSHSIDVYKGLIANWDRPFLVGLSQGDCRPHVAGSDCDTTGMPRFLNRNAGHIGIAIYDQAGFWLLTDKHGNQQARRLFTDGSKLEPRLNEAAIDRAARFLDRIGTLFPVVWLGPRIEPHVAADRIVATDCDAAADRIALRPEHDAIFRRLDDHLAALAADHPWRYVSEIGLLRFDIATELYDCTSLYWSDGDHWSPAGEAMFGARLRPAIEELTRASIGN